MSRLSGLVPLVLLGCPPDDGLVAVLVWTQDPATGCWGRQVEREWPEEYWGEQAVEVEEGCNLYEFITYMERDGECYGVDGLCEDWHSDPAVTICDPPNVPCCEDLEPTCSAGG